MEATDLVMVHRKKLLLLAVEELHRADIQELDATEGGSASADSRGLHRLGPLRDTLKGQPW